MMAILKLNTLLNLRSMYGSGHAFIHSFYFPCLPVMMSFLKIEISVVFLR